MANSFSFAYTPHARCCPHSTVPGIVTASLKGQWQFEQGKRDALLIMSKPRLRFLPTSVILDNLYKVEKLSDKWLVTRVHVCPAYSMYLSDKCTVSLILTLFYPPCNVPLLTI